MQKLTLRKIVVVGIVVFIVLGAAAGFYVYFTGIDPSQVRRTYRPLAFTPALTLVSSPVFSEPFSEPGSAGSSVIEAWTAFLRNVMANQFSG